MRVAGYGMITTLTCQLGRLWLRLFGWRIEGLAARPKFVMIAAPHTSNWDTVHMLAMAWALRVRLTWLLKDSLFRPPLGWFMRRLGALPIDRSAPQGIVASAVARFESAEQFVLAVAPEGTRHKGTHWKSGFYHIAVSARVPIAFGFLDYSRKVGGIGEFFVPTGDVRADMDHLRAFYRGICGKKPAIQTIPRLREEEPSAAHAPAVRDLAKKAS